MNSTLNTTVKNLFNNTTLNHDEILNLNDTINNNIIEASTISTSKTTFTDSTSVSILNDAVNSVETGLNNTIIIKNTKIIENDFKNECSDNSTKCK